MLEIQSGCHTVRSHGIEVARVHIYDWLILFVLVVIDIILNVVEPFHRFVGEDMMTDLKYPLRQNTVPFWAVPVIAMLLPIAVFLILYFIRRDIYDLHHAIMGLLFSILITGVITDAIKNAVGRPRPDFFWRCFPDGQGVFDPVTWGVICTGDKAVIKEGHKKFSKRAYLMDLCWTGFFTWYLSGKIRVFDRRGHIAKLCLVLLPLLSAALVGVSRVADYWHHWQDVFTGALLGTVVASFCYLQYFPPPHDVNGWGPYAYFQMLKESQNDLQSSTGTNQREQQSELESVYIDSRHGMEMSNGNIRDTSAVLDRVESDWRH